MSLRMLCYALSLVTLLLTLVGLGVLEPGASGSRSIQAIVSAAPRAGSDNRDNGADNRDNADNAPDNADNVPDNRPPDNRPPDNRPPDNSRDNTSSGPPARPVATAPRSSAPVQADDSDNDNFESLFDDDEFDDDDDGGGSRDGIDDFDLGLPPLASPADTEIAERVTVCAPSGQETIVRTPDGRASVQVPASMPQSVQLTLRSISITSPSIPPTSGLRLGGLVIGLDAERCEGGAMAALPAEVNLVLRYSDLDASAFDEARLVVALLDPATQLWNPVPNQVADPAGNAVSATITTGGVYTVYQTLGWAQRQDELGEQERGDTPVARSPR